MNDPPEYALASQRPAADPGDPNEDPFCSFWKGEDARVHAELCEVLEEAGIPHKTVFRRDHLFNFHNYPGYEIGVPFSMYERAEGAVKEAFGPDEGKDAGSQELKKLYDGIATRFLQPAEEPIPLTAEEIPGPPSAGDEADWYPEDATTSVWSTDASEPSDFLVAALHENGINCRVDQQGTRAKLYVLPHDAARAREIIREVVESEPPE
ncbi:MAG TPA: hypothetical protein VFI45_16670 [Candidatus Acidoferrum sp.]|nr:hypothetical protein [Candidatus Acidoferrum sp.]